MPNMDFSHLHVEFFNDAVQDKKASKEAGRPIFKDREMVRIRIAGDKHSSVVAPANDASSVLNPETQRRFTYAELHEGPYMAFKRKQEYHGSGTPLEELVPLTAAQRKTLNAFNVYTVEALAGLDGAPLQKLGMGAREWKNQAQAYLDKAAGTADLSAMAQENADLKAQMEALQQQMAVLMSNGQGKAETRPVPEESAAVDPWESYSDEDLKAEIKIMTGAAPRGNPKRETLIDILQDARSKDVA